MGNVKFSPKEPKADKESLILMYFYFSNTRLVYSTGEKIHPNLWNFSDQRARKLRSFPEYHEINHWIDKLEIDVKYIYRNLRENKELVTPEKIRKKLDIKLGRIIEKKYYNLLDLSEKLVNRLKISNVQGAKSLKTTYNYLVKYSNEYDTIDYDDIDLNFYRNFTDYMKGKGLSKNYIARMIGNIKRIMNEASDEGYNKNMKYKSAKFKREFEEVPNIYLTIEELKTLHKHDYSTDLKLDRVCDIFLIGAFTGLRFSDFSQLGPENIKDDKFVVKDMQKESGRVVIPIHWIVKEILHKYNGKIPKSLSNQKMNDYLKDIGRLARIDSPFIKTRTQGGKKVSTTYKKWQLMTTHTARRSMATNMYLAKVPIYTIMTLTGHKSVTQFFKYIKITEVEIAESLVDHEFFTKK